MAEEQDARIALLQRYSHNIRAQATIFLSLVIGFFSFIQSINIVKSSFAEWLSILYFVTSLGLFIISIPRTLIRLLYWTRLTESVLHAEPANESKNLLEGLEAGALKLSKKRLFSRFLVFFSMVKTSFAFYFLFSGVFLLFLYGFYELGTLSSVIIGSLFLGIAGILAVSALYGYSKKERTAAKRSDS